MNVNIILKEGNYYASKIKRCSRNITHSILIIAEGILMYFTHEEIKSLFNALVKAFPNAEVLFEMMTPTVAKMSKHHDTASKLGVKFNWGITSGKEMEVVK